MNDQRLSDYVMQNGSGEIIGMHLLDVNDPTVYRGRIVDVYDGGMTVEVQDNRATLPRKFNVSESNFHMFNIVDQEPMFA